MSNPRNVLVSTTSGLEGYQIESYLGVVSSHVVTGTNLFSDFFASLSDIFGGRSNSYKKQLASIHAEAVKELRVRASELGGNGIVGISIDHDEISGGGKSMFMVTATGTAVKVAVTESTRPVNSIQNGVLTSNQLNSGVARKAIIEKAQSWDHNIPNQDWEFLLTHNVHEVAPILLSILEQIKPTQVYYDPFIKKVELYFQNISRDEAEKYLYREYVKRNSIMDDVYKIMKSLEAFNIERIVNLLRSTDFERQKAGMYLADLTQPSYNPDDLKKLKGLEAGLRKIFVRRATDVEVNKTFSTKLVTKWQCQCGSINSPDSEYCSKCSVDQYGFTSYQIKPQRVLKTLRERINILESHFSSVE